METGVRQQLQTYYQQRAARLKTLKLDDVLSRDASVFWSSKSESVPQITSRLIEKYLTQFEDWWNVLIQDSESCAQVIHLRTKTVPQQFLYAKELANAHNRITREFLNRFSTAEDSVHWSKLLHNSGAS